MKTLRPYQSDAIACVYDWMYCRDDDPLIVLPTAAGKSLVMAKFIHDAIEEWPDTRILITQHVKELIVQNHSELLELWPFAPVGIYAAALKAKDYHAKVLFASVQSIATKAPLIGHRDILLVDEAHLISPSETTRYQQLITGLRAINPNMRVIGLTATPYRLGYGLLYGQEDSIFGGVAYEANILDLIKQGYLAPLVSAEPDVQFDVTSVHVKNGEYVASELADAVDQADINQAVVAEIVRRGEFRRSWLVFGVSIEHCYHLRDIIRQHGISCEVVVSKTPHEERDAIIEDFKSHNVRCMVSMNVLTTGFNARGVDLIALCRPTMSAGLYCQMVGRGARLADGKDDCLVLDFVGCIAQHGPVDQIRPPKRPGGGDAVIKLCPDCGYECYGGVRVCPNCGHEFEFTAGDDKINRRVSYLPVLSGGESVWIPCDEVSYWPHFKLGKPPTLKASYLSGKDRLHEWVCFEHPAGGFARGKAERWWRLQAKVKGSPVPATVNEAVGRAPKELRTPKALKVRQVGKYLEVLGAK